MKYSFIKADGRRFRRIAAVLLAACMLCSCASVRGAAEDVCGGTENVRGSTENVRGSTESFVCASVEVIRDNVTEQNCAWQMKHILTGKEKPSRFYYTVKVFEYTVLRNYSQRKAFSAVISFYTPETSVISSEVICLESNGTILSGVEQKKLCKKILRAVRKHERKSL